MNDYSESPRAVREFMALQLKHEFDKTFQARTYLHERWLDYAGWTIPSVYTDEFTEQDSAEQQLDYQSMGAQVVNHLANKITTVLFQPGRPFFRLDLTDKQKLQLAELGLESAFIDELLSKTEAEGMKQLTKAKLRTAILEVLKALIVVGNSLLYFPDKKSNESMTSQVYSIKDYTVERDMSGDVVRLITRDTHSVSNLPEDIAALIPRDEKTEYDDQVTIYTCVLRLRSGRFMVWQELENYARIPRRIGLYAAKDLPWIPLTWNLSRGRNYGTGLVEEYSGDFNVYSALAEALMHLAILAADIKILVDPMGSTDVTDLNESESGTYVYGREGDLSYAQVEKLQDAEFIIKNMEIYARRIGAGFLFNTTVTRDAERVTAEEIRMQANELEGSLGGVYSRLAEEMQLPIARRVMQRVGDEFKDVEPLIVTGVESLSRTTELDQIMMFFNDLRALAELPEQAAKRLDWQNTMSKLGAARQVSYRELLLEEDVVRQNDKDAAALAAQEKAASRPQQTQQEQTI